MSKVLINSNGKAYINNNNILTISDSSPSNQLVIWNNGESDIGGKMAWFPIHWRPASNYTYTWPTITESNGKIILTEYGTLSSAFAVFLVDLTNYNKLRIESAQAYARDGMFSLTIYDKNCSVDNNTFLFEKTIYNSNSPSTAVTFPYEVNISELTGFCHVGFRFWSWYGGTGSGETTMEINNMKLLK